ncbi:MAG: nucleotidyl transferase AbiEii/AbiGii toxin family protein [Bacteroidales bacterium]|nr:nucleotidyl transferase AbiEii/AbiGii toxin family protein [Bacteroidales bacterium]MBQ6081075.1 nucleotidyl transferase AbiEii/AbiGii toxin family protein [Bacteroidales bacterium]
MLQYKTINPGTLQLLKQLQSEPLLKGSRLVGGTALALQLGHRNSVDLDLFGSIPFSGEDLREAISKEHTLTIIKESQNIKIYLIDGVKVDIVNYGYSWIDEPLCEDNLCIAGIKDIAAMKVTAIIGRGTKKDFIDMYFLLQIFSLKEILDIYLQKYPDGSLFLALKSLSFFDDAEPDPMPVMYKAVSWDEIKQGVRQAIFNYC